MPLPEVKKGESSDKWWERCMSDENMKKEFPDIKVRRGVCYSKWEKHKKKKD